MKESKSIAAQLTRAELMLAGIAGHLEALSGRGIDTDFTTLLNQKHQRFQEAYNSQMALRARLMEKTEERQALQDEVGRMVSEARKLIKIELPPETWREFGIIDER
jgi:predicted nuclease with TOPRIM domain